LSLLETNTHKFPAFLVNSLSNLIYLVVITCVLTACATPAQYFETEAKNNGFIAKTVTGQLFEHRVYANWQSIQPLNDQLHVYLDGDGRPGKQDPTSRNPLILSLMVQDPFPSILLGRPCYHIINVSSLCDETLTTSKRYSQKIVDSMVVALNHWLIQYPAKKVILIGYSGGGTLAVLMADKVSSIKTVLTVVANLDTEAWSLAHGYPVLTQSLNPIKQKKLPNHIRQIHLAGENDDVVPAYIIKAYAEQQLQTYQVFFEFDHQCCWAQIWQKILQLL
jgi:hypothetical protein